MTQLLISTLQKNASEQIRVSLGEYRGADLVDIRVFTTFGTTQAITPTKKGVSIKREMLPALIDALEAAQAAIEAGSQ